MQPSSIGLATAIALTFATLGPANAGFVARAPRMIPPARPAIMNHVGQAGRFGMRDAGAFGRTGDRRFPPLGVGHFEGHVWQAGRFGMRDADAFRRGRDGQFSAFGLGYFEEQAYSPAADVQPPSFFAAAPVVNITVIAPTAAGAAHSSAADYFAGARPKIILVGPRPRATHFEKLPIVVYGRS
jgi:hypothetical protein